MNFADWSGDGHIARVIDLLNERAVPWLLDSYGGSNRKVLQSVLAHALSLGAQSAVLEYRYIDPDWRDEHRQFYATTFRRYPSVAHRVHFFRDPIDPDVLSVEHPATFADKKFLGYSVLRPVPPAPVGRTMLPPLSSEGLTCLAEDTVHLFGVPLTVTAAPFTSQDGQLSRCAQTTMWVTAYHHYLAFRGPRILPGRIARSVVQEIEHGRPVPSPGLTIGQIADAARAIGLPPLVYPLRNLAAGETIPRVLCRYLNSGLPVTVTTRFHAFVLVGYQRVHELDHELLYFIRQDDESGPYEIVDWRLDEYGPWEYAIVPLPEKVYLPGEDAEAIGARQLRDELDRSREPEATDLLDRLDDPDRPLSFRSTVVLSNEFKRTLSVRGYPEHVTAAYQRLSMSRHVWVVELTDRAARDRGEPCVLAEAVIDATDDARDRHVLAWRVPGAVWGWMPDEDSQVVRDGLPSMAPATSIVTQSRPH